jgi:hypothetical protein
MLHTKGSFKFIAYKIQCYSPYACYSSIIVLTNEEIWHYRKIILLFIIFLFQFYFIDINDHVHVIQFFYDLILSEIAHCNVTYIYLLNKVIHCLQILYIILYNNT